MATTVQHSDIELGKVRDGYPALAKWIAQDSDDDPLLYRKFGRSSARSLLHVQCRLIALENELDDLDDEMRSATDMETRRSLQRWETLMAKAKTANTVEGKLVRKLDEFETLLERYYQMLILRSQIAQLSKPTDRVLAAYKDFLLGTAIRVADNADTSPLRLIYGRASTFLEDETDLVALQKPTERDYLSRYLQDHWLFQKRLNNDPDPLHRTTRFKNIHIVRTVSALNMILAAVLLIGAIVHLYIVERQKAKLGLIAMYMLLFASCMMLSINARRAEVFTATAAYAAVLVVFVSGDLGGSEQCLVQLEGGILRKVKCSK